MVKEIRFHQLIRTLAMPTAMPNNNRRANGMLFRRCTAQACCQSFIIEYTKHLLMSSGESLLRIFFVNFWQAYVTQTSAIPFQ